MTIQQIAARLEELCSAGEFEKAQRELYADDAISIEPRATPGYEKETKGLQAIIKKGHQFMESFEELHGTNVTHPLLAGNTIAMALTMDITMKGKPRASVSEICVYQVKDGKIISEEFFD